MAKTNRTTKAAGAARRPTRCEEGGDEVLAYEIPVPANGRVEFTTFICNARARLRVWIEEMPAGEPTLLADQDGKDEIALQIPRLSVGRFMLRWTVLTPARDWQTRTELSVDGTVRFRRRKAAQGDNPVNMGFVVLEVS